MATLPIVAPTNPATFSGSATKVYLKKNATPLAADIVPLASDIKVGLTGADETIPIYGASGASLTIKTGTDGSGTIETLAPASNPIVQRLISAGRSTGLDAELWAIFEFADESFFYGVISVGNVTPGTPVRGAQRWSFTYKTTGEVKYQDPPII